MSSRAIELVHNGNETIAIEAARAAMELKCPHRVILGTDGPAGSGVQPLGILRMVAQLSSLADIPAEIAFCFATGNTARLRNLDSGLHYFALPCFIYTSIVSAPEAQSFPWAVPSPASDPVGDPSRARVVALMNAERRVRSSAASRLIFLDTSSSTVVDGTSERTRLVSALVVSATCWFGR